MSSNTLSWAICSDTAGNLERTTEPPTRRFNVKRSSNGKQDKPGRVATCSATMLRGAFTNSTLAFHGCTGIIMHSALLCCNYACGRINSYRRRASLISAYRLSVSGVEAECSVRGLREGSLQKQLIAEHLGKEAGVDKYTSS